MEHAGMGHAATGAHAWPVAWASFAAMWTAMMVPMMLPSLAPALRRHHRLLDRPGTTPRPARSTAAMAAMAAMVAGYYAVWAAIGVMLPPAGAVLARAGTRLPALARAAPHAVAVVVLLAGALQLTPWKARRLARCGEARARSDTTPTSVAAAWRRGIRLGVDCSMSCAGPMAVLLAVGMMDPRAMLVATAAITAERLAPGGARIARATGVIAVGAGLLLVARAAGMR